MRGGPHNTGTVELKVELKGPWSILFPPPTCCVFKAIKGACAEKTSPRKRRGQAVTEMVVMMLDPLNYAMLPMV